MKNKSTYSLLMNADAEEKGRSIFETVVYSGVVLCTVVSVWAFASGDVVTPGMNRVKAETATVIEAPAQPIVIASRG
jgi:hypothetical protein